MHKDVIYVTKRIFMEQLLLVKDSCPISAALTVFHSVLNFMINVKCSI